MLLFNNRLASDAARFYRIRKLLLDNPHLAVTGITYGWLAATFEAIDRLHRPGYVDKIKTPVLLVAADRDRVVDNRATIRLAGRLPNHHLATLAFPRHEILQERDGLRMKFWRIFDRSVD